MSVAGMIAVALGVGAVVLARMLERGAGAVPNPLRWWRRRRARQRPRPLVQVEGKPRPLRLVGADRGRLARLARERRWG